jgi:hypothetical protein
LTSAHLKQFTWNKAGTGIPAFVFCFYQLVLTGLVFIFLHHDCVNPAGFPSLTNPARIHGVYPEIGRKIQKNNVFIITEEMGHY